MKCSAKTKTGKPCQGNAIHDGLCMVHSKPKKTVDVATEEYIPVASDPDLEFVVEKSEEDVRARARERRLKRKAERDALGMLPGQKLVAPPREGFIRRWVNDDGSRINDLLDKGYTYVENSVDGDENILSTDQGTRKSQHVGQKKDGSPLRSYLMEQEVSLYTEDQKAKSESIDRREAQIRRVSDRDGMGQVYDPTSGQGQYRPE